MSSQCHFFKGYLGKMIGKDKQTKTNPQSGKLVNKEKLLSFYPVFLRWTVWLGNQTGDEGKCVITELFQLICEEI